jgi:hypothetical protein
MFEPVQRRVERALLDLKDFAGNLLDAPSDGPAVFGSEGQSFENQQVQRFLYEAVWLAHSVIIYNKDCR